MNFRNLFKKNKADQSPVNTDVQDQPVIDPSVFVEEQPPVESVQTSKSPSVSRLDKFFRTDHEWYGYKEGYANPSTDFMEMKLRAIRSEFRLELDRSLDELRSRCAAARIHVIKISGMPGRMELEIQEKIRQLETAIEDLERQKVLSVDDEGMISSAISRYIVGFTKGVRQYQQEKHFAFETGLF